MMPEVLDIAIVTTALAGAAWFVGRRLFSRNDSGCGPACAKCEPTGTTPTTSKSGLVQIGKPRPKP
jgi:hypothetical protein